MTRMGLAIWMILLTIITLLTLPYAWYLLKVIFAIGNILHQLEIFKWVAVGFICFAILRRHIKGNLKFVETFSHELTHTIFAFFFNRQVHGFHAQQGEGMMVSSGGGSASMVPVSLAPYCIPIFTLFLLSFRWMMDFHGMWIFDIIIGVTVCFHFYCFKTQIGNYQTDINQYPLLLSYSYIAVSWLIVLCIVIPAFFPNMNGHGTGVVSYNYGVFSAVWRLLEAWWDNLIVIFKIIIP